MQGAGAAVGAAQDADIASNPYEGSEQVDEERERYLLSLPRLQPSQFKYREQYLRAQRQGGCEETTTEVDWARMDFLYDCICSCTATGNLATFCSRWRNAKGIEVGFIEAVADLAITWRHKLYKELEAALQPLAQIFLAELPSAEGSGMEKLTAHGFQQGWGGDSTALVRQLIAKHEGEIREVWGEWLTDQAQCLPDSDGLYHPQFALGEDQRAELQKLKQEKFKVHGGTALRAVRGHPDLATNRVIQVKPAAVGAGIPSRTITYHQLLGIPARVPPVERIIYRHRRNQYVTLPELFFKYRYHFSCRELYLYYCGCEILAMRKARYKPPPGTESHAAGRREAAKARYKQGNHCGFADEETTRQLLAPALSPSAPVHRPMGLRRAAAVAPSAAGSSAWGSSSWESSSWNDTSGSSWGSRWRQTSWGDARTREQDAARGRR